MNSASVDLIYLDPPFNKGKDFHATPDSLAKGAKFQDRWSWEKDVQGEWADLIKDDHPPLMEAIESARYAHSDGMGAYMCFMAVRLMEMKRLLKDSGSIYLHCDPVASHYLKAAMDAIFGVKNFRNEIVWVYTGPSNARRWFPRKHDLIFFYAKSEAAGFHRDAVRIPYSEETMARRGRGEGSNSIISSSAETRTKRGREAAKLLFGAGKVPEDWWTNFPVLTNQKERYGYPTQKPIALLERIIKASSSEGDVVFDPFAGCATTCIAAERLGRRWVGIDIWAAAKDAVTTRMRREGLMSGEDAPKDIQGALGFADFHFKAQVPERTDEGEAAVPGFQVQERRRNQRFPHELLTRQGIRAELVEAQSGGQDNVICAGCGRRMEKEFMELDHITPRKDGGANDISNRILLCSYCNRRKRHKLTLSGLRDQNRKENWMRDRKAAESAQNLARERYELIRKKGGPVVAQSELVLAS